MNKNTTMKATIDIGAKIDSFQSAIHSIQKELNGLHLSTDIKGEFTELFSNFDKQVQNLRNRTQNNQVKLIDEGAIKESFTQLNGLYDQLIQKLKSKGVKNSILEKDVALIKTLNGLADKYTQAISKAEGEIAKANKQYEDQLKQLRNLEAIKNTKSRTLASRDTALQARQAELKTITDIIDASQKKIEIQREEQKNAQDQIASEKQHLKQLEEDLAKEKQKAEIIYKENHDNLRGFTSQFNSQHKAELKEIQQAQEAVAAAEDKAAAAAERATQAEEDHQKVVADKSNELSKATRAVEQAQAAYDEVDHELKIVTEDIDKADKQLKIFADDVSKLKTAEFEKIKQEIDAIDWDKFGVSKPIINSQAELIGYITDLSEQSQEAAQTLISKLSPALEQIKKDGRAARDGTDEAVKGAKELAATQSDIEKLSGRLVAFFSIDNAVRLFKRAVRSAMQTVKELDKVMTQTAVVTEFSVGDMWAQLPEYTKRANELGLAVKDVYEASTLYYQQGLKTNEVMQITNSTLRMARIAGLEASDATDRMTNALRGFNMEINEANADNIADVYSKLAAISASNVDEISTAMTKVASLANSANMQFETTAAFLAQIIETTRESAETAGTALKTVVARFSEVKDLYSKGELLGIDSEGEEIDVNRVSKALRTAGINLNEFLAGQKGLDEIFMELAQKWDSLDIVQQRYIATMAAGSRQQSRFIALMSDYARTQELTQAAQNASGASIEQYGKTLESIETKVNRLKNAWNEFLMGIANDEFLRRVLDALTNFLQAINKITDGISGGNGLIKSIASIGMAIGGLKIGGTIVKKLLGDPKTAVKGYITDAVLALKGENSTLENGGVVIGKSFLSGFKKTLASNGGFKNTLKKTFGLKLKASDLGLETIDLSSVNFTLKKNQKNLTQIIEQAQSNINWKALTQEQRQVYGDLNDQLKNNKIGVYEYTQSLDNAGIKMQLTSEQADKFGIKLKNANSYTGVFTAGLIGVGGALTAVGALIEKFSGKTTPLTKGLKAAGAAAMAFGAILPAVSKALVAFGVSLETIPIIGWAAAIISVLIGIGMAIAEAHETIEEKAEAASAALDKSKEAAEGAKTAYEDLANSLDKLDGQETEIEKLTRGTKEWQEAVREHNEQVMDLIGTYKELNVVSKGGVLTFTNADEIQAAYEARSTLNQMNQLSAQMRSEEAQYDNILDQKIENSANKDEFKILAQAVNNNKIWDLESLRTYIETSGKFEKNDIGNYSEFIDQFMEGRYDEQSQEDVFKQIREQAQLLTEFTAKQNNFYVAVNNSAMSMASLTEEQSKYADTLANTTSQVEALDQKYSEIGSATELSKINAQYFEDYYDYIYKLTGVNRGEITSSGSFKDASGINHDYREYAKGFETYLIERELAPLYKQLTIALTKMSDSSDTNAQLIAKAFEESGVNLSQADLEQLFGKNLNEEGITDLAERFWEAYHTQYNLGDQKDVFVEGLLTSTLATLGEYNKLDILSFKEFSTSTIQSFNNIFGQYISDLKGFGSELTKQMNESFKDLSTEDQEKIIKALMTADLGSIKSIQGTRDYLKTQFDFEVPDEQWDSFINFVINSTGALNKIDFTNFKDNIKDIKSLIESFKKGEGKNVIDNDLFEKIQEYVNKEDFVKTDYGVFYTGKENLGTYLENNLVSGLKESSEQLSAQQAAGQLYQNSKAQAEGWFLSMSQLANYNATVAAVARTRGIQGGVFPQQTYDHVYDTTYSDFMNQYGVDVNKKTLSNILSGLNEDQIRALNIPGLWDAYQKNLEGIDPKRIQDFLGSILGYSQTLSEIQSEIDNNTLNQTTFGGLKEIKANWGDVGSKERTFAESSFTELINGFDLPETISKALIGDLDQVSQEGVDKIYSLAQLYSQAAKDGLDLEELNTFSDQLQQKYQDVYERLGGITKEVNIEDLATRVAIANTKLNKGFNDILDSYKDWSSLIGENGPLGKNSGEKFVFNSEDQAAFNKLKKNLSTALELEQNLSDAFFDSSENMEALEKAMNGTAEEKQDAIIQLQKGAAVDILINADTDLGEEQIQTFIDQIQNLNIEPMEVGAVLQDEQFIAVLNAICKDSEEAGKQIAEALGVEQAYVEVGGSFVDLLDPERAMMGMDPVKRVWVPTYEMQWVSKGKPSSQFLSTQASGSGSDSGSKGSGGSSKQSLWKNPYDELYNLQEKINSKLREREKLEHRYQDLLKDHKTVAADLVKNSYQEIASLKQQLSLQNEMLNRRKNQMGKVLGETFDDSEGNRRTYASMGVQNYGWYEEQTQTIHIEWDKINSVTDENLGGAIESYISRLEEIRGQIQDTEDAIEDINDDLWEIQERGKEEYLDFEQTVYDAVVSQQQAVVDSLEKVNTSIKEATDKTIKSIQDEIQKERQLRENEKAQQDLYDKEMRLAYLQRDTSGANALEIQKLQEEINNDQQSYQDRIIDQTIQEMQDEATRAEEQRQAQIDLLQAQVDWNKDHGVYWENVEKLFVDGLNADGSIKADSELYKLLDGEKGVLSHFGEVQWKQDLAKQIAIAMQGRSNYEMQAAEDTGKMKLTNGTELSYQNGKWVDAKGNEYTNFSWNADKEAFSADKVKKTAGDTGSTGGTGGASGGGPQGAIGKITNLIASNIRSAVDTSTDKNILAVAQPGQTFDVVGFGAYDWYQVRLPDGRIGFTARHRNGTPLYNYVAYAQGGLVDKTGPAWLDGSKSRPELVLDAVDTQNFIILKNVLASLLRGGVNSNNANGDNYFDINIQADIGSDYDVDQLANRIKRQIFEDASYRNVNAINFIR